MATITAGLVKDLREKTGAGMMDCKNALSETDGDIEAAIDWLRKKGLAKAAKKSGRVAAEGLAGQCGIERMGGGGRRGKRRGGPLGGEKGLGESPQEGGAGCGRRAWRAIHH